MFRVEHACFDNTVFICQQQQINVDFIDKLFWPFWVEKIGGFHADFRRLKNVLKKYYQNCNGQ